MGEQQVPITIRKHPRTRRMVIRYQPINHSLTLTLPRYVSLKQGLSFVEEKRAWIERELGEKPQKISFHDGMEIAVLGRPYLIRHRGGRGTASLTNGVMEVFGDQAFLARRVRDLLVKCAREEIARLAYHHAARIRKTVRRIGLRDTHSHWGSCNQSGNMSFSWRLVLAPYEVMDYVVCHEVSHLVHMNHSDDFWRLVQSLCPDFKERRDWLKTKGSELYRYQI